MSGSSRVRSRISASATSPGRASPYFLQQNYGSPFVQFSGAAGIRTVELSTSDESTCRILIDGARVTSYRAMMWHGAVEEVLYAATNDDDVDGDDSPSSCNLIRGGLVVSFPASGAMTAGSGRRVPLGELAAQGEWEVTSASSAPNGSWAKVGLREGQGDRMGCDLSVITFGITPFLFFLLILLNLPIRLLLPLLQPSTDLLFAPSLAAHLSLSTINGARLIGCKGVRYCGSERGRQPGRQQQETAETGGLWGMGGLFGQLGRKKQSSGQEIGATVAAAAAAAAAGAGLEVSADNKEMVGQLRGLWREVVEGGEEGVERADYADIEAPVKRMFVDGPNSVTLLDRGRRLSFRLAAVGLGDLTVHAADETCGLREWDEFLCVGFSCARRPLTLAAGGSWTGTFTVTNLGAP
ncbi:unnamed protein product [Closterium sp. Naga37s-1]|nr:unnamed protein product [Closterium sp. Naga37s-1]